MSSQKKISKASGSVLSQMEPGQSLNLWLDYLSPSLNQTLRQNIKQRLQGKKQMQVAWKIALKTTKMPQNREKRRLKVFKITVVSITGYRRRFLDDDNFRGGLKALRDQIADYIGLDDSEKFVRWKYYQVKVENKDEEGTAVRIKK